MMIQFLDSIGMGVTRVTQVLTVDGPTGLDGLIGRQFNAVVNKKTFTSGPGGFVDLGRTEVYRIMLDNLQAVEASADQLLMAFSVGKGIRWMPVGTLVAGNKLVLSADINDPDHGALIVDIVSIGTQTV